MTIAVRAAPHQLKEWYSKNTGNARIHPVTDLADPGLLSADAFIDLHYTSYLEYNIPALPPVIMVSAVTPTCRQLPDGFIRINAWPGFLQRSLTELAVKTEEARKPAEQLMQALGWNYCFSPDIPGMVTARVVSMLINEAFFALEESVSTRSAIDTAMKLGTNYPYGPFEWCDKIGAGRIVELLQNLSAADARYLPAPLLMESQ